jgi:ribosome-associated protein
VTEFVTPFDDPARFGGSLSTISPRVRSTAVRQHQLWADTGWKSGSSWNLIELSPMSLLRITPEIAIEEFELEERFVLSSGPGGQNVNKVASAVELRFDAAHSPSLSDDTRARLRTLAGRRMTKDGVLILQGNRFRDQQRNRADVRERLIDLIAGAAAIPKRRKATKPSRAAKERRLQEKKVHSRLKSARGKRIED